MNGYHVPTLSDEEACRALTTLGSLLEQDAAAEDKLAALDARTEKHRRSNQRLQEAIYFYRAIIAPVRLLPLEVLGSVFGFLVVSAPDAILRASQVCRMWRNAALAFPHLWSNIDVHSESSKAQLITSSFLERAGQSNLSVTFTQSEPSYCHWANWINVKASALRWSSLSLHMDSCYLVSRELRSLPATRGLTELGISIRKPCSNPLHEGQFGFEADQNDKSLTATLASSCFVKVLRLSTFILPSPGMIFHGIVKFYITDTFSTLENPGANFSPIRGRTLTNLLRHCPNLEELTFDAEATVMWFVQNPVVDSPSEVEHISLPQLQTLHLNCHCTSGSYVMSCLRVPKLEALTLKMRPRHLVSTDATLQKATLAFLTRSPHIRRLHVFGFKGIQIVAALVIGLRDLEVLHLDRSPSPDVVVRTLSMHDRFNRFDQDTWLAPKLTKFLIDAEPPLINQSNLLRLLVRYRSHVKNGYPKALVSVVVNNRDVLEGARPGKMLKIETEKWFGGRTWEMYQKPIEQSTNAEA